MKRWVAVFVLLIAAIGFWVLHSKSGFISGNSKLPADAAQDSTVAAVLAKQNSNVAAIVQSNFASVHASPPVPAIPPPSGIASPLQFTNFAPSIVLENMGRAVRQYGQMFGGNPVGNNAEITAALNGNNPRKINFISAEAGMRVNGNGELIDAWGTPYFFHQLSGSDMEIHSAGPDRVMWTADDLVFH